MKFYNSTFKTGTSGQSQNYWGNISGTDSTYVYASLIVSGLLEFDGDNGNAYIITNVTSKANCIIGCLDNYVVEISDDETITNHIGNTEFRVGEITTDGTPDVIFNQRLWNWRSGGSSRLYTCGLRKTGDGVFSLIYNDTHNYSGKTIVDGGGLLLSAEKSATPNDAIVNAGGAIGGIGKITGNLTVNAGGGFAVDNKNIGSKLTVSGTLALPGADEGGLLYVYNYDGKLEDFKLDGIDVIPAKASAEQKAAIAEAVAAKKWTARLHGYSERKCAAIEVTMTEGKFNLKYKQSGFVLIVR